jgi:high affinity Mn2+ porin
LPACCLQLVVCALLASSPVLPGPQTQHPTAAAVQPCRPSLALVYGDWYEIDPQTRGASTSEAPADKLQPLTSTQLTFFSHPDNTRWWLSGQENTIYQMHGNFHSPYQGPNSFTAPFEYKASVVGTVMTGFVINPNPRYETEIFYDEESAGGRGLSQALGLAGFTNLDVVRNPNLGLTPYVSHIEIHQTIGLTDAMVPQERGPLALATQVPMRRFEFRVGKFGLPDMLDINPVLSDSHQQFTNWTIDNDGAWDYAADTRGYTYGVDLEYQDRAWALRYVIALMPTVANGITLDWALRRARGENMEYELRKGFLPGKDGVIRVLAYGNYADMGLYRTAVIDYLEGITPTPEITFVQHQGELKYGVDFNVEQNVTNDFRIGGRFGWNEGQHESFAYTEDDQTFLVGGDYAGTSWGRKLDKVGVAFVTNAIKKDHQNYLKFGGLGFVLGDGRLNYAREDIVETYYNVHLWRGLYGAIQNSFIEHPGYNQDRGPVDVEGARVHLDF